MTTFILGIITPFREGHSCFHSGAWIVSTWEEIKNKRTKKSVQKNEKWRVQKISKFKKFLIESVGVFIPAQPYTEFWAPPVVFRMDLKYSKPHFIPNKIMRLSLYLSFPEPGIPMNSCKLDLENRRPSRSTGGALGTPGRKEMGNSIK